MNKVCKMKISKQQRYKSKASNLGKSKLITKILQIKQKRKIEEKIRLVTKYDIVTDLPNRVYFFEKLNKVLKEITINNRKGAIIYINIDNYKVINEFFGNDLGDLTLKVIANLINNCLGEHSELTRLNGDEFAILVYKLNDIEEIKKICSEIYEQLKEPFKIMNNNIYINVSMGISIFPDNSMDSDELIRFCNFAMCKSKNNEKNTYTIFNNEMSDTYYRETLITIELKNAINNNELDVFYQPQIDSSNNQIIGMEALLRWNNNKLGNVSPAEFIPIAEKTGDIIEIGEWVLDNALKQACVWKGKGYRFNTISVNISAIQMRKIDFKKNLLNMCTKYNIPSKFFEIEITESNLIDICKEKIETLTELMNSGINIAIDDFGTGYSSLNYLINLPINTLKIDKTFVDKIYNYKNRILIKSIIDLAKSLKYKIVTEGVETKEQLDLLTELGCNIIQGFYFSKPLPKNKMEDLLKMNSQI